MFNFDNFFFLDMDPTEKNKIPTGKKIVKICPSVGQIVEL